jgi:hypothetical protein
LHQPSRAGELAVAGVADAEGRTFAIHPALWDDTVVRPCHPLDPVAYARTAFLILLAASNRGYLQAPRNGDSTSPGKERFMSTMFSIAAARNLLHRPRRF